MTTRTPVTMLNGDTLELTLTHEHNVAHYSYYSAVIDGVTHYFIDNCIGCVEVTKGDFNADF